MPISTPGVRFGDSYRVSYQKKGQKEQRTKSAALNAIPTDQFQKTMEEMQDVEDLLGQVLNSIGFKHTFRYAVNGKVDELFLIANGPKRNSYNEFVQIRDKEMAARKADLEAGNLHNVKAMSEIDDKIAEALVKAEVVHQDDEPLTIQYHTEVKEGKTLVEIDNPQQIIKTLRINPKMLQPPPKP